MDYDNSGVYGPSPGQTVHCLLVRDTKFGESECLSVSYGYVYHIWLIYVFQSLTPFSVQFIHSILHTSVFLL